VMPAAAWGNSPGAKAGVRAGWGAVVVMACLGTSVQG
jgi:hypothetical protein